MNDFKKLKYKLIRNCISEDILKLLTNYFEIQKLNIGYYKKEQDIPYSEFKYADKLAESLLLLLKPTFENETDLTLHPTYSYFRYYKKGSKLKSHTDRPACEISGTLVVDYHADYLWPIYLSSNGNDIEMTMNKGDLLIYKGRELPHWRKEFTGESWLQIFLHYVDKSGQYTEFKNDKRPHIGYTPHK